MKMIAAAAVVAVLAGCTSAPAPSAPAPSAPEATATHYWESSTKASENRYRVDNLACQSQTGGAQAADMFEPDSESFDAYRSCMISRGYVLRQY